MRHPFKVHLLALTLILNALSAAVLAQESGNTNPEDQNEESIFGLLRAEVTAEGSGAPVAGALVSTDGHGGERHAQTDEEGEFAIELRDGSHSLEIYHPRFGTSTFEVTVSGGETLATTFTLREISSAAEDTGTAGVMEEVVVTGAYTPRGAGKEEWSDSVIDVLSSEDFSITGDSTVVSALNRVPGVTVVDGQYVYVRGLGERYSNTLLNDARLPSPEPARRVVPLDMFPSGVMESLEIQKTYSPYLPADFSGGTVQMFTRQVPDEPLRRFSFAIERNSETTGEKGLVYRPNGRNLDYWLGRADGDRDIPGVVNEITNGGDTSLNDVTPEEQQRAGLALDREYDTKLKELDPNFTLEGGYGDRYELDSGGTFGFVAGGRYKNSYWQREEERATFGLDGQGGLVSLDEGTQQRTDNIIDLAGLVNLEYEPDDTNLFRSVTLLTRRTDSRATRDFDFLSENDINVADTTLEWIERQLLTQQFSGEHFFDQWNELEVSWHGTYAKAERKEPDTRFYRYEQLNDGTYLFSDTGQSNERRWEDLNDEAWHFGVGTSLPTELGKAEIPVTFRSGLSYFTKDRDSELRRFRYLSDFSQNDLRDVLGFDVETVFADENIAPDLWELNENTQPTDNYEADEDILSLYAMADVDLDQWRLTGGFRYEDADLETKTFELANPDQASTGDIDEQDVLPSINATWLFRDDMQLRFGYSRTVNRPDLRELSEAPYIDPDTRYVIIGNPDLDQAEIDNFDVRWEWYPSAVDSIQVAAFYKDFTDPIEQVIRLGAGGVRSFANADSAENYGLELQVRKSFLDDYFVKFNGAVIDSEVDIGDAGAQQTNDKRALQGQSDWVVNLQLGYDNPVVDAQVSLAFNMSGERIVDVGTQGLPDAKEQPVPLLDFNYRQRFELWGQAFRLKAKARNLLDEDFETERGNETERKYNIGRSIELGFDWEF